MVALLVLMFLICLLQSNINVVYGSDLIFIQPYYSLISLWVIYWRFIVITSFISQVVSARRQQRNLCIAVFGPGYYLPTCLPHMMEALHCPILLLNAKQETCKYQFLFLSFLTWSNWNQTRAYRFDSRLTIHSKTDWSHWPTLNQNRRAIARPLQDQS